jgi:putative DNA primase/helicase
MITYTIEQLEAAFPPTSRRPGAATGVASLGPKPDHIAGKGLNLNAAAHEGLHSFASLSPEQQNAMLAAMLELPAIQALADTPRNEWRDLLFSIADAEQLGATDARPLALEWSKTSKRFEEGGQEEFDNIWNSFKPNRKNGITIGTLLRLAYDAGFDLGAWLHEEEEAEEHPAGEPPPPEQPGSSQEPSARPVPIRYSDSALAYLFTDEHAENLLYVHLWGTWLFWRSGRWCVDHAVKVFDAARILCAREGKVAIATMGKSGRQIAAQVNKAATVAAIERLARHHYRHVREGGQFDADPMLLNTPNNTLDLRGLPTPERAHRRDNHMTRTTAVSAAAAADCPRWMAFLLRIMDGDQSMVDYLQRVCGYCLTGSVEEHALFFGYGSGANGKGTFAAVVLGILNTDQHGYAAIAPISTFTASHTDQHPTDLAMLRGKRCVIAQETEEGRSWAVAKLKMMTGGDRITARFMRQDFFTYEPQFKILILGNHKPALGSVDEAIRRRVNIIPFTVKIPEADRDPKLGDKLKAEYPQILRWMLEGCAIWQRDGLRPPAKVIVATETYLTDEDRVGSWINECCTVGPTCYGTLVDLFNSWGRWANQNGEVPGSRKELAKALDARPGLTRKKEAMTARAGWDGIAVKADSKQAPGARMAGSGAAP